MVACMFLTTDDKASMCGECFTHCKGIYRQHKCVKIIRYKPMVYIGGSVNFCTYTPLCICMTCGLYSLFTYNTHIHYGVSVYMD